MACVKCWRFMHKNVLRSVESLKGSCLNGRVLLFMLIIHQCNHKLSSIMFYCCHDWCV